jgi:hypothetical protein
MKQYVVAERTLGELLAFARQRAVTDATVAKVRLSRGPRNTKGRARRSSTRHSSSRLDTWLRRDQADC